MAIAERTSARVGALPVTTLRILPAGVFLLDVLVLSAVGTLAVTGRKVIPLFDPASDAFRETVGFIGPLIMLGWLTMITLTGGYRRDIMGAGAEEFKRVVSATLLAAGGVGIACYLTKFELSRGYYMLSFLGGAICLLTGRWLVRRLLHALRRRGHLQVRVLIAGTPGRVDEVSAALNQATWLGYTVVGAVTPDDATEETPGGVPVIGNEDDLLAIARRSGVDVLMLTGGMFTAEQVKELVWALEPDHIDIAIAPALADIAQDRLRVLPVEGVPIIHVERPSWVNAGRWGKRAFDLVGSFVLLIVLAPVFLLSALLVWGRDRGSILFRQTRTGHRGVEFSCLKFRTMVMGAEHQLEQLKQATSFDGVQFKLVDDPRVTGPGRMLRRFSVDELPQLVNVLRGEMSLVGPRPLVPNEVEADHATARRLHVRPGMTGLWQVSGRSDLSWEEALRLDLYYVDNWSMLRDISILARTISAVLRSRGAY